MGMLIRMSDVEYLFENKFNVLNDKEIWEIFHFFVLKENTEIEKDEFVLWMKKINENYLKLESKFKKKVFETLFNQKLNIYKIEALSNFVHFLTIKNPSITFMKSEEVMNWGYFVKDYLKINNIFSYKSLVLLIHQDLRKEGIHSNWIYLINPVIEASVNDYFWINQTKTNWTKLNYFEIEELYKEWLIQFDLEKIIF